MRVSDWPWAEANDGRIESSDRLADRLARLSAGHPSADLANDPDQDHPDPGGTDRGDASPDDGDPADADPDGPEPDDHAPDDLEPGSTGPGQGGDGNPAAGIGRAGHAEPATWHAPGASDRSPYRPWFSADGAGDPWFAEPTEWTGR